METVSHKSDSTTVPIDLRNGFEESVFGFEENQFCIKNMKSISITISYNIRGIELFKSFVENNKNTLRSIAIYIKEDRSVINNQGFALVQNDSKMYFKELVKVRQLHSLRISCHSLNFSIIDYFKQLADICPNLTKISVDIIEDISPLFPKFFESLEDFKELKVLNIFYGFVKGFESFPFKILKPPKKCHKLMELSITGNLLISDEFFDSIHTNLPKLQSIICKKTYITDKTFQSLSKLSNLKRIDFTSEIQSTDKSRHISRSIITETYFFDLLNKCRNLSEFKFDSKPIDFHLKVEDLRALRKEEFPSKGILLKGRLMSGKECKQYFPQLTKATIEKYL